MQQSAVPAFMDVWWGCVPDPGGPLGLDEYGVLVRAPVIQLHNPTVVRMPQDIDLQVRAGQCACWRRLPGCKPTTHPSLTPVILRAACRDMVISDTAKRSRRGRRPAAPQPWRAAQARRQERARACAAAGGAAWAAASSTPARARRLMPVPGPHSARPAVLRHAQPQAAAAQRGGGSQQTMAAAAQGWLEVTPR